MIIILIVLVGPPAHAWPLQLLAIIIIINDDVDDDNSLIFPAAFY